jgi:hypothetical protein
MKIEDLRPGMLLKPIEGYMWVEIPWRGSSGDVVGHYIRVSTDRYKPAPEELARKEKVLYLGDSISTGMLPTPGKQVVLAWGKKMTIDPSSWRHICCVD